MCILHHINHESKIQGPKIWDHDEAPKAQKLRALGKTFIDEC